MEKDKEKLDNLMDMAGEAESAPPLPDEGIPRQWLPSWIRWPFRVLFLPFVLLDIYAQKLARIIIRPPFKQVGKCLKRGSCCHYILINEGKGLLGKLHVFWSTQINGFFLRDSHPYDYEGQKVLVMGCRYLKKDGSCKHYSLRPMVCRQWPVIEHFGRPRMLKGCGFKAVPRNPTPPSKKSSLSVIE